jgi:hypothetical protein
VGDQSTHPILVMLAQRFQLLLIPVYQELVSFGWWGEGMCIYDFDTDFPTDCIHDEDNISMGNDLFHNAYCM